jgi:hypothetical protein
VTRSRGDSTTAAGLIAVIIQSAATAATQATLRRSVGERPEAVDAKDILAWWLPQ